MQHCPRCKTSSSRDHSSEETRLGWTVSDGRAGDCMTYLSYSFQPYEANVGCQTLQKDWMRRCKQCRYLLVEVPTQELLKELEYKEINESIGMGKRAPFS
ncbi:hypothetical protein CISG_04791 [Coccidioides immitis RMSCC 3703]|uniref:Uncharacterized protein n=2 Tax=Coccidioides immitis TaxID=5501 RepID=A0A0J8TNR9_COCIT|nr:hypothetical protein CIRG_09611 [Coccidioides immitis RMSCC 2394]KMU75372.1 hypothetical protein CISG_04791 [Coccidioides immitis RMSCC 3703]